LKQKVDSFFADLQEAIASVQCTDGSGRKITRDQAYESTLVIAQEVASRGNKLMFVGNGGSAGISSHMAIDFSKNGQMPAMCFNDGAALTCLGNDFGYEQVFSRQIQFHARKGDVLFAISSSGRSPNILCAVEAARGAGCSVITFSAFLPQNPLRSLGEVNFYVASEQYGVVEVAHTALVHAVVELKLMLGGELARPEGAVRA